MALTTIEKALQDFVCEASGLADTHVIFMDGMPRPEGTYITLNVDTEGAPADDDDARAHNPLVLDARDVEAVNGDALTVTGHPYVNGDGPLPLQTTGTLPAPLSTSGRYWIIVDDENTIRVASTRANARAGVAVTLTDAGTGVHTIVSDDDTRRIGEEIKLIKQGQRMCEVQIQCYSTAPTGSGSARAVLTRMVDRSELSTPVAILNAAGIGAVGFDTVQMFPEIANRDMYQGRAVTVFTYFVVASQHETNTTIEQAEITNPRGRTYRVRRV